MFLPRISSSILLGSILLAGSSLCQGQATGAPVIAPATGAVAQGETITFRSQTPVKWTLARGSYGKLTVNSPTSATYTAPSEVTPNNVVAGCPAAPNDTVYNMRVDKLPVDVNSDTWTSNAYTLELHGNKTTSIGYGFDMGTNVADRRTPVTNETFLYTPQNNGPFVTPQWPYLKRQAGVFTSTKTGDHHTFIVDKDNCNFYELYQDFFTPQACGTGTCTAESGIHYSWSTYALPLEGGSTDASGLLYGPTLLHLSEMKAGAIHHALKFVLGTGLIRGGSFAAPYWPSMTGNQGGKGRSTADFPYGARLRLKANYDISSFSPEAQVILTALKHYGMILTDATYPLYATPGFVVNTDVTEDPAAKAVLDEIAGGGIPITAFEAVDESSFEVSPTSAEVNPANGYEKPHGYAVVTATDPANPANATSIPIAVEAAIVGVASPTLYVAAGTPAYDLDGWVRDHNSRDDDERGGEDSRHRDHDNASWSLVSGVGSVSWNGAYTPPAHVAEPEHAVLQLASRDNSEASAKVYVTVLPTGRDGDIRIDSGSLVPMLDNDTTPRTWLADQGFETSTYRQITDAPDWPDQSNPDIKIYQSTGYTYGDDIVYSFVVPNGNYKVRLLFGQPYNGCLTCAGTTFNPHWHAPLFLEANGQIGAHNYDFGKPINYLYATPVDAYIPAKVTNKTLYVAVRANVSDALAAMGISPSPQINGLEIIPDSTPPHLTIDTQQNTSVAAGSTLQLYAVGWYMSNSVTWRIVSGPGSIDQTGLYTAPAGPSTQPVTIVAISNLNRAVAAVTLAIPAAPVN